MKERVIKRYANRKLYDVKNSRHISLAELAEVVRAGEQIRVTDKLGREDYTARILHQIIIDESRSDEAGTVGALHEWIRTGGRFLDDKVDAWKKNVEAWLNEKSPSYGSLSTRKELDQLRSKVEKLQARLEHILQQSDESSTQKSEPSKRSHNHEQE